MTRPETENRADELVERILARAGTALQEGETDGGHVGDEMHLEERAALRRVVGLSTELDDIHHVENRQLRLERVILVGVFTSGTTQEAQNSLRELAALATTAGSQVLDGLIQRRQAPDPATYLGSGKARELADLVKASRADTVIVDTELAPSQRRGLEDVVQAKVIDRTALILDIFAQHAKSKEGKAQVELAQLEYLLPRLRGWGESMSRQAGGQAAGGEGIGSRGPGETKIELDRRRIRSRMAKLRREIKAMGPARETRRQSRKSAQIPAVAIAGYTNAGKSSLLNRLTGAGVLVDNELFATLDPTVRRSETEDGRQFTIADTVGFVRHLPTELVEAFRSTLEEVAQADVVVHVVDASHADPEGQIASVREVLRDIPGVEEIPELVVLNKADLADPTVLAQLRTQEPDAVIVSARTGKGLDALREQIAERLPQPHVHVEVIVPYDRGDLVHRAYTHGEVLEEEHLASGTRLEARVDAALARELRAL